MKSVICRWGSHAALVLPAFSIEAAGYRVGQKVQVTVSRGRIVIQPLENLEYDLETLVENITDANSHDEVSFDEPMTAPPPVPAQPKSLFGYMRSTLKITGDVIAPTGEQWSADAGGRDTRVLAAKKKSRVRRAGMRK